MRTGALAGLAVPLMSVDRLENGIGQFDGFEPRDAIHNGSRPCAYAVEEATEFEGQRVSCLDRWNLRGEEPGKHFGLQLIDVRSRLTSEVVRQLSGEKVWPRSMGRQCPIV